jgi:2-isopropylmalate synthase
MKITFADETLRDGVQDLSARDAFHMATGVHAAAIVKTYSPKQPRQAGVVTSGVRAQAVGGEQIIEIGPLCGKSSNDTDWLEKYCIALSEALVWRTFDAAKKSDRVLTNAETGSLRGMGGSH